MAGTPDRLPRKHGSPAGGAYLQALLNHSIGPDVRDAVGAVLRPAVGPGRVPGPSPQNPLDKVHAIKAEHGRRLIGGGLNHFGAGGGLVVVVIAAIPGNIAPGEGRSKTAHNIEGLVVGLYVLQFLDKFGCLHFRIVLSLSRCIIGAALPGGRLPVEFVIAVLYQAEEARFPACERIEGGDKGIGDAACPNIKHDHSDGEGGHG